MLHWQNACDKARVSIVSKDTVFESAGCYFLCHFRAYSVPKLHMLSIGTISTPLE